MITSSLVGFSASEFGPSDDSEVGTRMLDEILRGCDREFSSSEVVLE